MGILSNIEPKEVFHYFEELSMVPRSAFHTKKSVIFVWNLQKLTIWNISRMK